MSRLSQLADRADGAAWKQCHTCAILEQLDPTSADHLRRALANPLVQYAEIRDALLEDGIDVSPFSLSRHARGLCDARQVIR